MFGRLVILTLNTFSCIDPLCSSSPIELMTLWKTTPRTYLNSCSTAVPLSGLVKEEGQHI